MRAPPAAVVAAPRPIRPMPDVISTRARSISLRTIVLTCRPRSPSSVPMLRLSSGSRISDVLVGAGTAVGPGATVAGAAAGADVVAGAVTGPVIRALPLALPLALTLSAGRLDEA